MMKVLLRRPLALSSIVIPLLVLAALFADTALAAPAAAAPPAAVETGGQNQFVAWASEHMSGPVLKIAGALAMFIIGWVIAKSVSYGVYTLLTKTDLDNKLAKRLGINLLLKDVEGSGDGEGGSLERFVAKVVYILLMLLVIVGVLGFAGFQQMAAPLQGLLDTIVQAFPRVAKAALILTVAYVAGRILKIIVSRALDTLGVDSRFAQLTESTEDDDPQSPRRFSAVAGNLIFWLLIVFGLAGALEALEIEPLAAPLRNAIDRIVGLLPSLGVAAIIMFVGFAAGRILRVVVRKLLQGLGFDNLMERFGLSKLTGDTAPSDVVGLALMVFVIMQATIAALNELGLSTLAGPLTEMVGKFWNLLPILAVSIVIVFAGVFVGGLLRRLVGTTLRNVGFDRLMERLGFGKVSEREDRLGEFSEMVAFAIQVGVVMLAVAQALDNLALDTWSVYVNTLLAYVLTNVAVALAVVLVGFIIGGYVRDLIHSRQGDTETGRWIAEFARYVVLVFAFTMAVSQLGVAEDFVLMTFGLLFGALCLAMALAFGLGSREVAGDIVKRRYEAAQKAAAASGGASGSKAPGTGLGAPKTSLGKPPSAGGGTTPPTT